MRSLKFEHPSIVHVAGCSKNFDTRHFSPLSLLDTWHIAQAKSRQIPTPNTKTSGTHQCSWRWKCIRIKFPPIRMLQAIASSQITCFQFALIRPISSRSATGKMMIIARPKNIKPYHGPLTMRYPKSSDWPNDVMPDFKSEMPRTKNQIPSNTNVSPPRNHTRTKAGSHPDHEPQNPSCRTSGLPVRWPALRPQL